MKTTLNSESACGFVNLYYKLSAFSRRTAMAVLKERGRLFIGKKMPPEGFNLRAAAYYLILHWFITLKWANRHKIDLDKCRNKSYTVS